MPSRTNSWLVSQICPFLVLPANSTFLHRRAVSLFSEAGSVAVFVRFRRGGGLDQSNLGEAEEQAIRRHRDFFLTDSGGSGASRDMRASNSKVKPQNLCISFSCLVAVLPLHPLEHHVVQLRFQRQRQPIDVTHL